MKKAILTLIAFVAAASLSLSAQTVLGTYNTAYDGIDYTVELGPKNSSGNYEYLVSVLSDDPYIPKVKLVIKNTQLDAFLNAVKAAKQEYKKKLRGSRRSSDTTAEELGVSFPRMTATFLYNGWHTGNAYLTPEFKSEHGMKLLVLKGDEVITDYVDCDGFRLVFSSENEIDSFIKLFDARRAEEIFEEDARWRTIFN